MTTAYLATACALWFVAGAAVAWRLTALHYRSRLKEATQRLSTYQAWWERDSGRAIVAVAKLDLIHQQHVDAGRKAHEPFRALRRETTEKLMQCVANRDARSPLDAEPCSRSASRTARETQPSPAPLSPRAGSTAAPLIDPVEQKGASHG